MAAYVKVTGVFPDSQLGKSTSSHVTPFLVPNAEPWHPTVNSCCCRGSPSLFLYAGYGGVQQKK